MRDATETAKVPDEQSQGARRPWRAPQLYLLDLESTGTASGINVDNHNMNHHAS
jgi:hypothetical protein